MEEKEFSEIRVLLVGSNTDALQLLRSLLATAGVRKIIRVDNAQRALELLSMEHVNAVFCDSHVDYGVDQPDEKPFVVALRRCKTTLNPTVPIIVLQECARRRDVEKARDAGVTDVLTTPISPKILLAKLKAAVLKPRPFIVASEFFGPDRRANARTGYFGSDRRTTVAKKVKVDFGPA